MKSKHFIELSTDYDIDFLISSAKKRLNRTLLILILYSFIFAVSVLAIIFLSSCVPIFIIGIIAACASAFFILKRLRAIRFSDFKASHGEIVDVLKESTTVRSITGGYGMYVTRKYDAFAKSAIRLTVSIKTGDDIHSYVLDGVAEDHSKYYELKGDAVHIYGTHFPVKLDIGQDKWLCPICGEFNMSGEKTCVNCKQNILK